MFLGFSVNIRTQMTLQYVAEKYPEEQGFLAGCYQVVELDGPADVIKVGLERAQWTKVMDGQWEIQPAKSTVSPKHNYTESQPPDS